MNIQFQIVDIFHFSAGYTVFVGALSEEIPTITSNYKYMANLVVEGSIYQENILDLLIRSLLASIDILNRSSRSVTMTHYMDLDIRSRNQTLVYL